MSRNVEHELFIRSFFAVNPPKRVADQFVANMEDIRFEPGEVIYNAGDPAERLFFIVTGTVQLVEPSQADWELGDHSMIGILDAALKRPYAKTAIAKTAIDGIVMDVRDYLDILEDNFDFTKTALTSGCARTHELALNLAPDGVFPPLSEQSILDVELLERITEKGQRLDPIERLIILNNARFFIDAPIQPLVSLAAACVEKRWAKGEILFSPNTPSTHINFVAHGCVVVESESPKVSACFGAGGMIGGISAVGFQRHRYIATARTDSIVLTLSKEELFDAMEDHVEFTRAFFGFLSRENLRIRSSLAASGKTTDIPLSRPGSPMAQSRPSP